LRILTIASMFLLLIAGEGALAASKQEGNQCKLEGDPSVVIQACTRIIEAGRETVQVRGAAYYSRANAYSEKGDQDRAISDYGQAIKLTPQDVSPVVDRGDAYVRKGDYDHAIVDFSHALSLCRQGLCSKAGERLAFANRGAAYLGKRDLDRAIADFGEAIRIDPGYVPSYSARGLAHLLKSDLDSAIKDYSDAIRLDPKSVDAYNSRAGIYQSKGDFHAAIADRSEVIALDPKNARMYFLRGVDNLYMGSLPKALADLTQASALNPKDAYTALWLDIVQKRSNLPSQLVEASKQIDMTSWPAPVIRLYLGQLTPDALMAAADDRNAETKQVRVCEANFYSGEHSLQAGAKDEAIRLFKVASDGCANEFVERPAANAELKALSADRRPNE
jgi:lipoprotein NlpI